MINEKKFSLEGVQINEPYSASDVVLDIGSHFDLVRLDMGSHFDHVRLDIGSYFDLVRFIILAFEAGVLENGKK